MPYKDYSDARDFYASEEWARAKQILRVVYLYFAICKPARMIQGPTYNTLMEIAEKNYTVDQAIEAFRSRTGPGVFGWEAQQFWKHWRELLENHPEYGHLKPEG